MFIKVVLCHILRRKSFPIPTLSFFDISLLPLEVSPFLSNRPRKQKNVMFITSLFFFFNWIETAHSFIHLKLYFGGFARSLIICRVSKCSNLKMPSQKKKKEKEKSKVFYFTVLLWGFKWHVLLWWKVLYKLLTVQTIATSDIYSSIFFYRDIRNYLPIKINPQAKSGNNTWMH